MSEMKKIVAVLGMEQYSRRIWTEVKQMLAGEAIVCQYTDIDLENKNPKLAEDISSADCIFASMINFRDQVEWFQEHIEKANVPVVFIFESMPEAMELTKVGSYVVKGGGGGMPDMVKKVAKLLVKGRDEDSLYGYVKLLKLMRTMLPLIPKKAKDFKNWMQVYAYWTNPSAVNIANMFRLILCEYFDMKLKVEAVVDIPTMGLYHPEGEDMFKDMSAFNKWSKKRAKTTGLTAKDAPRIGLIFFRKHLLQEKAYIDDTIKAFEKSGLFVYPVFVMGVEGHVVVRDWLTKEGIDVLVNMMGFGLVGGPAGSTKPGTSTAARDEILRTLNVPYIVAQPLFMQDFESWERVGVAPMQTTITYSLPEMDGAISPIVLGALNDGRIDTVPNRLNRLVHLCNKWATLRRKANKEKKLAFIVYDYPPGLGKKASAALLDVPTTLLEILQRLKKEGYHVGELPATAEDLLKQLDKATDHQAQVGEKDALCVSKSEFATLTTQHERERIENRWGAFPGDIVPMGDDKVFLGGIQFGNIFIGVQPRLGVHGDPMRLIFDKENTPHHQYIAFYRWLSRSLNADAMIHVGMHGSVEWMPGLQLGLTENCWPDALCGELPHLYIYPVNNPSEANMAKRRGLATMISHAIPPLSRSGLYKELPALKEMLDDYRERGLDKTADEETQEAVLQKVAQLNLNDDCPRVQGESFSDYLSRLYIYLRELENRLISNSLHVFGKAAPIESQIVTVTETLKVRGNGNALPSIFLKTMPEGMMYQNSYSVLAAHSRQGEQKAIELREKIDDACKNFVQKAIFEHTHPKEIFGQLTQNAPVTEEMAGALDSALREGRQIVKALEDNSGEMNAIVHVLNGGYLPAGPGGDIIRDGANVLPTGRNIHAIDPWRIPSEAAFTRGTQIADSIVKRHYEENGGLYPETIAQVLWGLDTIKTKGEAVAVIIRLMGGQPAYDAQGKISHYELIPLEKLGRPRIDVVMQLSPVFRDTFGILMNHLDKLVQEAAKADEPHDMNYIKKHVDEALANGAEFESATARQFTQAPGAYGTYVDDMVEDSAWESEEDLDNVFIRRNAYAYGGKRHGAKETEILKGLMSTVDRVVHQVDSVEFGISDIDHYFSSSGSLQLSARRNNPRAQQNDIKLNYVEAFTADVKIDDVDTALRVEYRTKLLNPKWYEGMLQHGHSGATEISNRFTYMLGWDAVTKSVDDWVYKKAAETYAFDPNMRERLMKANPQAMKNIVGRLLEANGRGMWEADQDTIDQLQELYSDLEDRLEGIQQEEA
ncbi:magnesium chelatase, H subunit [Chloroherpeton thalassium ATCC 35110]|uniref:magnesium chelatase n=1 Tax=Chloroherpeton thalassium (strain ATCC 35110 / GB-78) TaxID=517418 RepID=B3QT56_CHLT3|nr:magnesium chelatase subunit H [Chloroherpeton thalassium]ACF14155.1 magnesium chelatase, H subunit [Chloroherpeton thalassium ATCC 35110]